MYTHETVSEKSRINDTNINYNDRLCGLVVRVPGYRSTGLRFDFWRDQVFWKVVSLEWGPLSLVRIIEELLERNVAAPV
jgi:hypothetical protein